jgi:polysaccharide export outer membrane protein
MVYIQNKASKGKYDSLQYAQHSRKYLLTTGDVLNIRITSKDPAASAPFKSDAGGMPAALGPIPLFIAGYSIDDDGYVTLPVLGKLKMAGLTLAEARQKLFEELDKYIVDVTVDVKLVSFKVTVLGEVRTPGLHFYFNERITLFEAIGLAGDITDLGNRKQVRIVRNYQDNIKIYSVDLTSDAIIPSDLYYILPNDVIYVEPLKAKNFRINLPAISLALSGITAFIVLFNFFTK